jgi:riboflavin kinase / FMN adenylyltransferase
MTDRRKPLVPFPVDRVPDMLKGGAVAVGNFDGVHRGHAALLEHARTEARRLGIPSVVLTFEPHPRTFFRPETPVFRLTPLAAKARVMAALGIDGLIVATFDKAFASIEAEDFVASILRDRLDVKAAVVGHDFHFGKARAGTPDLLRAAGERLGFPVTVVEPVGEGDGRLFASTDIRAALAEGDVAAANRLLGYRWFVVGEVVPGDRRGRELGFPTANLRLAADCALRHGVYAVRLQRADGSLHDGVASFGRRPTFDDGAPIFEVNVFDFAGDLYGETVAVSLVAWLRPEARFPSADALVVAMNDDAAAARTILAGAGAGGDLDRALATIGV